MGNLKDEDQRAAVLPFLTQIVDQFVVFQVLYTTLALQKAKNEFNPAGEVYAKP